MTHSLSSQQTVSAAVQLGLLAILLDCKLNINISVSSGQSTSRETEVCHVSSGANEAMKAKATPAYKEPRQLH